MARFSNKIESLRYADIKHKTIEILYKNGESINSYYIEVDYNNQDFLDLLEECSIEEIEDQTKIYYEELASSKNNAIYVEAKKLFDEWVKNAQKDLDKQDRERYDIFETYKEEQLKKLDSEVENRIAEGFVGVDEYREKQLAILQKELDEQVVQRYKEADEYKDSQINIIQQEVKTDLLSKFNSPSVPIKYTPEKVARYMIDNFKDEDTVFKTKLEIFNLPEVKNSKDREMKMKVRKAKTVPEIFAAYHDIQCNHS